MKNYIIGKRTPLGVALLDVLMKTFIFLCCTVALAITPRNGFSQNATVTLEEDKLLTVEEFFKLIDEQTDYTFIYRQDVVKNAPRLSFRKGVIEITKVLQKFLEPIGLTYDFKNSNTVVVKRNDEVPKEFLPPDLQFQISGTVVDEDNVPLPGANILEKGTANGTQTDFDGNFTIQVASGNSVLSISYIGFETKEINVEGRNNLSIRMVESSDSLDEVVVIGYGTVSREKLVTPISTVNPEIVAKEANNSIDRSLEGKIAGLTVRQGSGGPGGGSVIQIRGTGTVGGNAQPLVVVDGIPMQPGYSKEQSPLSFINPNDVSSIDVLKGASATAIYGSRGANGVIMITTKSGREGKTEFSFSAQSGIDMILPSEKLDLMNAEQFARWRKENEYEEAAFYGNTITDADIPEVYRNPQALGRGTDWYDVVTGVGHRQDYNFNVTHGSEQFKGFFSMGYTNHTGVVQETDFERVSFRANMSYTPSKYVELGLMLNPTIREWNNQVGGNRNTSFGSLALATPLDGPYRDSGAWERDNTEYWDGDWDMDIWSPGTFSNGNALHRLKNVYDVTKNFNFLATPSLTIKPLEGLSVITRYNLRLEHETWEYFEPSTVTNPIRTPPDNTVGQYNTDRYQSWQWENMLTYDKSYVNHDFSILLGYTMEHYNNSGNRLMGTEFPDDDIRTINASVLQTGSSVASNWSLMSYIGRFNYDYKAKYLLTAALRRDGSSRFGSNNRWAYFPTLSVGWNVDKEAFFPESSWFSKLKIRGGYGTSGNNRIGNYTWIPTVVEDNYTFGGNVANGKSTDQIENSLLGWERTEEIGVGIDIALFQGRVRLFADYYDRNTQDMLWGAALPFSSGFGQIQSNLGEIENKGYEFALSSTNISTDRFKWNMDFNISLNRNKVIDLGETEEILTGWKSYSLTRPGEPMAMFYGWEQIGVFNTQEEVDNSATKPGQLPGTVKFRDLNNDGVINNDDRTIIGNPHAKFRGGFVNSFDYGNLDLSIAMSFAHDFDVFSQLEADVLNLDGVFNVLTVAENRWRSPQEPGNGIIPASFHQTNFMRDPYSTMVNNVSFLKCQNITLGYNLDVIDALSDFRVFLSVQNAFLWTNYKYGNPDVNREGANPLAMNFHGYDYPLSRTISMGVNLKF